MRAKMIASILVMTMLSAVMCMAADDNDEKRQKARKMAAEALQDLYKLEPTSQATIQKAAGYAVFDNMGVNVLLLSTARGSGLAVNNKTKQETFMKMGSAGVGVGMGVKDYVVVFVFGNEKRWHNFWTPAGPVRGKRTLRPRQVRRAGLTQERLKLPREYGSTRSPRMVSHCS
jgi:lipid-binding SYLF domain-containing protein